MADSKPIFTNTSFQDEKIRFAIMRDLIQSLNADLSTMDTYRAYYEGEQDLVYGSEDFKREVEAAYPGLRDNWCEVVVDAPADKLEIEKIQFLGDNEEVNTALTDSVWRVFRLNDIDEQQTHVYEGALVEGRSAVIVWPDDILGARIDWQPGQNVIVRYADDDWRVAIAAIKRWEVASGDVYVNLYTRDFVYKYKEPVTTTRGSVGSRREQIIPNSPSSSSFVRREVDNEPWPLPNPFGEVPVVEFVPNKGSKLKNAIPKQDMLNYLVTLLLFSAENNGYTQRVFFTGAKEPVGGWQNKPGKVWHLPPTIDSDGKMMPGAAFEFSASDLSKFKESIEMTLQHLALTSKTPMRMFFHSDRGGRGDAPSGDSLLVSDDALIEYIERIQSVFGNSWLKVATMVAQALDVLDTEAPVLGETKWIDPRARYRTALLEEAKTLSDIGVPLAFIVTKLGLSVDEVTALEAMVEEQEREQREMAEAALVANTDTENSSQSE